MRRVLFFAIPLFLAIIIFAGITIVLNQNSGKGALQVTATPKSSVFLNGKMIGQTPLCKCEGPDMLAVSDYTIRISPLDTGLSAFEQKITIGKGVLTVVDRTFGKGATSEGSIISLSSISDKKASELLAMSFPDNANVFIDSTLSGTTPLLKKDLTISDHEIKFSKDGYREKSVRIRTVFGYKLSVLAFLGVEEQPLSASPSALPTQNPTPTLAVAKVVILQTPTGFLRVRDSASLSGGEIAQVKPGDTFELISEVSGWFEIKLLDGKIGWVSSSYAQKQ